MAVLTRKVFAARLGEVMEAANLTPRELAARGWPQETISRWRNEKSGPPGLADRRKLASAMGLVPDAFGFSGREWEKALKELKARRETHRDAEVGDDVRLALLALLGAVEGNVAQARELLLPGRSDDLKASPVGPHTRPTETGEARRAAGDK